MIPPLRPPPDTPPLNEADPKFARLSVREQLAIHRDREACASCHRSIDPWGIALENYDAIGLWRDTIRRKVGNRFETLPIMASDMLPGDIQLDGMKSLKRHLVTSRRDDFARSLVSRLTTYAIGRQLELGDETTVDRLTATFAADDYRMRSLIKLIVSSEVFQTK